MPTMNDAVRIALLRTKQIFIMMNLFGNLTRITKHAMIFDG